MDWAQIAAVVLALIAGAGVLQAIGTRRPEIPLTPPYPAPPRTMPTATYIHNLAAAIAQAEGYFVSGSKPQRYNNPLALRSQPADIDRFATAADGWAAGYHQLELIYSGRSRYYQPSMTILQVAEVWTGEVAYYKWAQNVARALGVSTTTTLADWAAGVGIAA